MPATSLTIVLPAFNDEARLGPALDELFGYLHRRSDLACMARSLQGFRREPDNR